ncbi:hypothetical protein BpHYR1_022157 [Brachionus plicatilis]|uniref:Uncharacterized protein n=1 Tax=Brachionus plicatilis TaxID=10195 RepID=A0A3M7SL88_BRAPC|nr:hypothetical protein BpHYR1_022157 [Brachionus plicatilis]
MDRFRCCSKDWMGPQSPTGPIPRDKNCLMTWKLGELTISDISLTISLLGWLSAKFFSLDLESPFRLNFCLKKFLIELLMVSFFPMETSGICDELTESVDSIHFSLKIALKTNYRGVYCVSKKKAYEINLFVTN